MEKDEIEKDKEAHMKELNNIFHIDLGITTIIDLTDEDIEALKKGQWRRYYYGKENDPNRMHILLRLNWSGGG